MAALAAHGPHMTHGHHFQPYPSVSMGPIWGFKVRPKFFLNRDMSFNPFSLPSRNSNSQSPSCLLFKGQDKFLFSPNKKWLVRQKLICIPKRTAYNRDQEVQNFDPQLAALLWVSLDPKTTLTYPRHGIAQVSVFFPTLNLKY